MEWVDIKDRWLWVEDLPKEGCILQVTGKKVITTRKGQAEALVLCGNLGGRVGDLLAFPSKISNIAELKRKYVTPEAMFGKEFKVIPFSKDTFSLEAV